MSAPETIDAMLRAVSIDLSVPDDGHDGMMEGSTTRLTALLTRLVDAERKLAIVCAPGSYVKPSAFANGNVVAVDGRTGADACEKTADAALQALLDEQDGLEVPMRVELTFTRRMP